MKHVPFQSWRCFRECGSTEYRQHLGKPTLRPRRLSEAFYAENILTSLDHTMWSLQGGASLCFACCRAFEARRINKTALTSIVSTQNLFSDPISTICFLEYQARRLDHCLKVLLSAFCCCLTGSLDHKRKIVALQGIDDLFILSVAVSTSESSLW